MEDLNIFPTDPKLQQGIYRHYKGGLYKVLGVCHHSESTEKMVLYQALYDSAGYPKKTLWVRPLEMFLEEVEITGKLQPHFQFLGDRDG